MEYKTAIVDECGCVIFWCSDLQGQKEIDSILARHPEWYVKAIQIG